MENILEIKNCEDYDYSNIKLSNPTMQNGNNYYTNITIGDRDKPLYLQFPKCTTKAGCVKNNSRCYTDLIFSASDTNIIKWLENFEIYLQNEIYKKRNLWFDSDINLDDIQELMTPTMRSYKSGKNILIRCNIKNHKCSVYDEDEILLNLDNFTIDKEIIPLLCINGIKFSSKNFTIELNLTQLMILSSKDDLEKSCLIKSSLNKKIKNNNNENSNSKKNLESQNTLDAKNGNILLDIDNNQKENLNEEHLERLDDVVQLSDERVDHYTNKYDNKYDSVEGDNIELDKDINNDKNLLEICDDNDKDKDKDKDNDNDNVNNVDLYVNEDNNIDILDEIDLETIDVDIENKDSMSEINIKDPNEIYYEIYKNAIQKAINLKKNTIAAFLNAKNIKLKYNLEDLDDDINLENNININLEEINNMS